MALHITYLAHGSEHEIEIYTRAGVERFLRLHGARCLVDVKGALGFLPQHNVGATADWLDRMGGVEEFDLEAIDALRQEAAMEAAAQAADSWYF